MLGKADGSEDKSLEQSSRLSELAFRSFFEKSNAILMVIDPEKKRIIEANKAALEFYGYTSEELFSIDLHLSINGFIEIINEITSENLSETKSFYIQRHQLKNSNYRDVEIYPTLIKFKNKDLIYLIIQDITTRKKAIEALKESETKKLALLKLIPDLILVFDGNSEISDIYTDSPNRLPFKPQKLLGKKSSFLFPEGMCTILEEKIKRTKETRDIQSFDYRYKKGSNLYVYEEVRVISGGEDETLVIIRDITQMKATELELKGAWEEAKEANRVKSIFLANISHEIRTPINAILGFSELLEEELKNSDHIKYIESIKSSSKTLMNLINDLLDLSKIEAGKMTIKNEDFDLQILLAEIKNIFSLKLREKGLIFKTELGDSVPKLIRFDEMRLRQIFLNVIGNAIKFTEKGEISITIQGFNQKTVDSTLFVDLKIEILDTGIGINEKNIDSIFDAFKQTDDLDNRKYGGTGLGLAITKRLVELLNGTIVVKSKHGVGSLFTLNFFNVEVQTERLIEQTQEPVFRMGYIRFKHASVLIADDVKTNRDLVKGVFKGGDLTFFEAKDGLEAIDIIKKEKPKIALLDLRMPIVDGLEVAQFIKLSENFKSIKTIGISADPSSYLTDERNIFLDDFISKPINISVLLRIMSNFIPYENINQPKLVKNSGNEIKGIVSIKDWSNLEFELENKLKSITNTSSFYDYEDFANLLIDKGKGYNIDEFVTIGKIIFNAVKCFDLETILIQLNEFKIVKKIIKDEL